MSCLANRTGCVSSRVEGQAAGLSFFIHSFRSLPAIAWLTGISEEKVFLPLPKEEAALPQC